MDSWLVFPPSTGTRYSSLTQDTIYFKTDHLGKIKLNHGCLGHCRKPRGYEQVSTKIRLIALGPSKDGKANVQGYQPYRGLNRSKKWRLAMVTFSNYRVSEVSCFAYHSI